MPLQKRSVQALLQKYVLLKAFGSISSKAFYRKYFIDILSEASEAFHRKRSGEKFYQKFYQKHPIRSISSEAFLQERLIERISTRAPHRLIDNVSTKASLQASRLTTYKHAHSAIMWSVWWISKTCWNLNPISVRFPKLPVRSSNLPAGHTQSAAAIFKSF